MAVIPVLGQRRLDLYESEASLQSKLQDSKTVTQWNIVSKNEQTKTQDKTKNKQTKLPKENKKPIFC